MQNDRHSGRRWLSFKFLLALVVVTLLIWIAVLYREVRMQSYKDETRTADVIVVFGAAEYAGRPSPVFRARLDHAFDLFKKGIAPVIITTGGKGGEPQLSEGGVGRDYLIQRGVPENNIIAETQSDDTSQSAARVANIMRTNGFHTCVAVSDGYHMFRIKQMLAEEGIEAYGAPRPEYRWTSRWQRFQDTMHEVVGYILWKMRFDRH
jgi:uncharacterized SAM-binding protein YcdF (DUF218 family)